MFCNSNRCWLPFSNVLPPAAERSVLCPPCPRCVRFIMSVETSHSRVRCTDVWGWIAPSAAAGLAGAIISDAIQ